jgi:hypothetical protein
MIANRDRRHILRRMLTSRRAIAAAVAISCFPLAFVAGAAPASAASCSITPKSATLYEKTKGVTFDVPAANRWSIDIQDLFVFAYDLGEDGSSTASSLNPIIFTNDMAGAHDAVVTQDENADCVAKFNLKRGAKLGLAVSRDGSYRNFSGQLKRVNFGFEGGYRNFKGAKVALQRKTKDGWVTVKTVKTKDNGTYSAKVKAGKHTWRALFAGTSTTGVRSSASKVK